MSANETKKELFKETFLLLEKRGFWRSGGSDETSRSGICVGTVENYRNQDGVEIMLFEQGKLDGKVQIYLNSTTAWTAALKCLAKPAYLDVAIDMVEEMIASAKQAPPQVVHPGMRKN